MIGGYLMDNIGPIRTFRVLAMSGGIGGLLYFFSNLIYQNMFSVKKNDSGTDKVNSKEVSIEITNEPVTEKFHDNKSFIAD